jgi:hypothetical protein
MLEAVLLLALSFQVNWYHSVLDCLRCSIGELGSFGDFRLIWAVLWT